MAQYGSDNGNYKGYMHRKCKQCSGPINSSSATRKFCSRDCQIASYRSEANFKTCDRTSERQALRRHVGYAAWRDAVFARDSYACRACTASGVQLEAHHHAPWGTEAKLRLKVSNGITLCRECHRLWHAYDRKGLFSGKESALQSKVIAALVEYGFYVFNVPGTPMGTNGVPDLIVCYEGVFGGLECKVFPNYLTEPQKAQGKRIVEAGGIFYVVQSEDDIGRVIELFETRRRIKSAWSETFSEGERDGGA